MTEERRADIAFFTAIGFGILFMFEGWGLQIEH
jgi:hypothetical protein